MLSTERNLTASKNRGSQDSTKKPKKLEPKESKFKKQAKNVASGVAVVSLVFYTIDVSSDFTGLFIIIHTLL